MRPFNCPASLLCIATLLLAACSVTPATPSATTEYDRNYDFNRVHKIAIQPITKGTLATMMISDEQISRIDQALAAELQRRSFQVVTVNADADMFLSWQLVTKESADDGARDPAKQTISEGMLLVSMIDPIMLQSVWRATFKSKLLEQLEPAEADRYRQEVAQAILAQFPPSRAVP